jgi:hypothetical protein
MVTGRKQGKGEGSGREQEGDEAAGTKKFPKKETFASANKENQGETSEDDSCRVVPAKILPVAYRPDSNTPLKKFVTFLPKGDDRKYGKSFLPCNSFQLILFPAMFTQLSVLFVYSSSSVKANYVQLAFGRKVQGTTILYLRAEA